MDTKSSNPRLTTESLSLSSGSNFSTPSASVVSTPTLEAREFIGGVPPKVSTNPLLREYPQPARDIDVEEALERQPGRWSLHGQMKANQKRAEIAASRSGDKEQKMRDFETAKRELLDFHAGTLQNASGRK